MRWLRLVRHVCFLGAGSYFSVTITTNAKEGNTMNKGIRLSLRRKVKSDKKTLEAMAGPNMLYYDANHVFVCRPFVAQASTAGKHPGGTPVPAIPA